MNINLPITDPDVVSALPDTSVYDIFFNNKGDVDAIKKLLGTLAIRKKLQFLFGFTIDGDIKTKLINNLINAFEEGLIKKSSSGSASGSANGQSVSKDDIKRISDGMLQVGTAIYDFKIFSIGNSFFANADFKKVFFTKDMFDYIFGLNDTDFENSLFNVPEFWNNALSDDDLYNHFKLNYADRFLRAIKLEETAFAKIIIKETDLDFTEYNSVTEIAAAPSIMDVIESSDSKKLLYKSIYGFKLVVMSKIKTKGIKIDYVFTKLKEPISLSQTEMFVNVYALNYYKEQIAAKNGDSISLNKANTTVLRLLGDDILFGEMLSRFFNLDKDYTFTQFVNDDNLSKMVYTAMEDKDFDYAMESNSLLGISDLYENFINKILPLTKLQRTPVCVNNDDNSHVFVFAPKGNKVELFDVVFPDATSSQFDVPATTSSVSKNMLSILTVNKNKQFAYISAALRPETDFNELQLSIEGFKEDKIIMSAQMEDLVVLMTAQGNVLSNKFIDETKIDPAKLKQFSISKNNYMLMTDTETFAVGDFGSVNPKAIKTVLDKNFSDLKTIFTLGDKAVAVLNSGDIKEVQEDALADYTGFNDLVEKDSDGNVTDSAVGNKIVDAVVSLGTVFVLDAKNNLWYKDIDGTVKKIVNVVDVMPANEGLLVAETNGTKYLLVKFNKTIRKYDYLYNL